MPITKRATLSNGLTLPYVEQGDPDGVPVVFLHGVTDSWRSFEGVLPCLPSSIHAFAVTQRGHGDADRPEGIYRLEDFAGDVAAFLDAVDIERAVIVGHSMGSYVAQRFALDFPERTLGVVLAGAFVGFAGNDAVQEFTEFVMTLEDPVDPAVAREFQESTIAQPVAPGLIDTATAETRKLPARVWKSAFQGMAEADFAADLPRISAPTLIIWGDQDSFMPRADQDELAASIPNSELAIWEGAGHSMHWEEPERFAIDVERFAESCASRPQPVPSPARA